MVVIKTLVSDKSFCSLLILGRPMYCTYRERVRRWGRIYVPRPGFDELGTEHFRGVVVFVGGGGGIVLLCLRRWRRRICIWIRRHGVCLGMVETTAMDFSGCWKFLVGFFFCLAAVVVALVVNTALNQVGKFVVDWRRFGSCVLKLSSMITIPCLGNKDTTLRSTG